MNLIRYDLEVVIDSHITGPIIIGHCNLQGVRSLAGQAVKLVKTDPNLSWKNIL